MAQIHPLTYYSASQPFNNFNKYFPCQAWHWLWGTQPCLRHAQFLLPGNLESYETDNETTKLKCGEL